MQLPPALLALALATMGTAALAQSDSGAGGSPSESDVPPRHQAQQPLVTTFPAADKDEAVPVASVVILASPLLPGSGLAAAYHVTPRIWAEGSFFNRHSDTNLDSSLQVESLIGGVGRVFLFHSFNLSGGFVYRRKTIDFANGKESENEREPGVKADGKATGIMGSIGNQWIIGDHFVLGADWFDGFNIVNNGGVKLSGTARLTPERKALLKQKATAYNGNQYPNVLKLRLGWSF